MHYNLDWILPAVQAAIRAGDLAQARVLVDLYKSDVVSSIPLIEAIRRGEERLELLQIMLDAPNFFATFDAYVAAIPAGEQYRNWLGGRPDLRLVAGTGPHSSLPGGYLWVQALRRTDGWCVIVNDCDDGMIVRNCADEAEAQQALGDLMMLAPISMFELDALGYAW